MVRFMLFVVVMLVVVNLVLLVPPGPRHAPMYPSIKEDFFADSTRIGDRKNFKISLHAIDTTLHIQLYRKYDNKWLRTDQHKLARKGNPPLDVKFQDLNDDGFRDVIFNNSRDENGKPEHAFLIFNYSLNRLE